MSVPLKTQVIDVKAAAGRAPDDDAQLVAELHANANSAGALLDDWAAGLI